MHTENVARGANWEFIKCKGAKCKQCINQKSGGKAHLGRGGKCPPCPLYENVVQFCRKHIYPACIIINFSKLCVICVKINMLNSQDIVYKSIGVSWNEGM